VRSQAQQGAGGRVSPGQLLPHSEYRIPILRVLDAAGGALPVRAVLDRLRPILDDRLTPLDLEELPSGHVVRWENRAQWVRFALVREGLLDPDAPRGVWRLTERGSHEARAERRIRR
jgi:restriction system protein